jgi:hypothetical protein
VSSHRDPYEVLGLPKSATHEQTKRRYEALMKRLHPDVVRDPELADWATARAKELNEAMELLGDPVRRATNDSASSPAQLAVYDVSPEIDEEEGDRPMRRFKVDRVEGSVPAGSELVFSATRTSNWLRIEPLTVRSIRDDKPFPKPSLKRRAVPLGPSERRPPEVSFGLPVVEGDSNRSLGFAPGPTRRRFDASPRLLADSTSISTDR